MFKWRKRNKGTLIICDIQQEFSRYMEEPLINNLKRYKEKYNWKKIIVIVDKTYDTSKIPVWLKGNQILYKKFGGLTMSQVRQLSDIRCVVDFLWEDKDNNILIRSNGVNDTFLIPKEMVSTFRELKHEKVTLVGGAFGACLTDIFDALRYFSVNVKINKKITYSMYPKSQSIHCQWVEV